MASAIQSEEAGAHVERAAEAGDWDRGRSDRGDCEREAETEARSEGVDTRPRTVSDSDAAGSRTKIGLRRERV